MIARLFAGAVLAAALLSTPIGAQIVTPISAQEAPAEAIDKTAEAPPPASPGFRPWEYLDAGDAFNCPAFASQADAQAVLRADPSDPNNLDTDKDGIACESNRAPRDTVPVAR